MRRRHFLSIHTTEREREREHTAEILLIFSSTNSLPLHLLHKHNRARIILAASVSMQINKSIRQGLLLGKRTASLSLARNDNLWATHVDILHGNSVKTR